LTKIETEKGFAHGASDPMRGRFLVLALFGIARTLGFAAGENAVTSKPSSSSP